VKLTQGRKNILRARIYSDGEQAQKKEGGAVTSWTSLRRRHLSLAEAFVNRDRGYCVPRFTRDI